MRGILGLGAEIIDRAVDFRHGVGANEESGLRLDELVEDPDVRSALAGPELSAADLEILTIPGWLWYLDYLADVARPLPDELLAQLWMTFDHPVLQFRILESVLINDASIALLDVQSLDGLHSDFWRLLAGLEVIADHELDRSTDRRPTADVASVELLAGWLLQVRNAPATHLLRLLLGDGRTQEAARDILENFLGALAGDPSEISIRREVGLDQA